MAHGPTHRPGAAVWSVHPHWDVRLRAFVVGLALVSLMVMQAHLAAANQSSQSSVPVALEAITDNPTRYVGQTVSVRGEVDESYGPRAFSIDNGEWFDDDLLILDAVGPEMAGRQWAADDRVQVLGTVHLFRLRDFEQQMNVDLDDARLGEWEGKPVVFAWSVYPAVAMQAIVEDPAQYQGRIVTVRGEIEDVVGPGLYRTGGEGWFDGGELLVVSTDTPEQGRARWVDDDRVQVTGSVSTLWVSEAEREFGLDLDNNRLREWQGKPVLFAWTIQSVRGD